MDTRSREAFGHPHQREVSESEQQPDAGNFYGHHSPVHQYRYAVFAIVIDTAQHRHDQHDHQRQQNPACCFGEWRCDLTDGGLCCVPGVHRMAAAAAAAASAAAASNDLKTLKVATKRPPTNPLHVQMDEPQVARGEDVPDEVALMMVVEYLRAHHRHETASAAAPAAAPSDNASQWVSAALLPALSTHAAPAAARK